MTNEREPRVVKVPVSEGELRCSVTLVEEAHGSAAWHVRGISVESDGNRDLTVARLRGAPWRRMLVDAVDHAPGRLKVGRLRRLSDLIGDPPRQFLEDRRGRAPLSDLDYANLAERVLAKRRSGQSDRQIAQRWAASFGFSEKTWQKRIGIARRRFIFRWDVDVDADIEAGEWLTDEGIRLAYGEHAAGAFDQEAEINRDEEFVRVRTPDSNASDAERATARWIDARRERLTGIKSENDLASARARLASYYDSLEASRRRADSDTRGV